MISREEVENALKCIREGNYDLDGMVKDVERIHAAFDERELEIEKLTKSLALKGICEVCEEMANKENVELRKEIKVYERMLEIMRNECDWLTMQALEQARKEIVG